MSDYAIKRLSEDIANELEYRIARRFEAAQGTPIERIFETSLWAVTGTSRFLGCEFQFRRASPSMGLADMPFLKSPYRVADIWYWTQYQVLDWKVDFVIGGVGQDGKPCFVVIECDGHDFHERTKDQAAKDRSRDRRLQDAGYRIHRYTGREIYKDAYECAQSALCALVDQMPMPSRESGAE